VPLSEHEQRLLEQIEQSLYAEDPKFARSVRGKSLHSLKRARLLRAVVGLVVGVVLLLAGVMTLPGHTPLGIGLGVGGFLVMLAAAWYALSTRNRLRPVATGSPARPPASRRSVLARLEERWQRRQDEQRGG
jgi:anti-sigma-K factor RskA